MNPAHPLANISLFAGLPPSALDRLARAHPIERGSTAPRDAAGPRERDMVFRQNDASDALYAILGGTGHVRVGVPGMETKRLMVELLKPGDVFGEIGTLENAPRTADAFVEGPVTLLRIPAAVFHEVLAETPRLGVNLALLLAGRLRRTFNLFQDATFVPLEVRLARQLLYLAERAGRRTERGIRLTGQLRQGDLADLLGTTTRSIITVLNAWRAREWVSYDGDKALLIILAPDRLQALVAPA